MTKATNDQKSILITGASSGIGAALARDYAAPGVHLALAGRDRERLETVAADCRDRGSEVATALIDVAEAGRMEEWIGEMDERSPLDLVIANAGMALGVPKDTDALGGYMETIFATNVHGVFNTLHPAIARMAARGRGQVAIMSSMAGYFGLPSSFGYSAAKVAVKAYGEGLRGHLEGTGVAVSVICPGFVETALTARNRFPMPFLMPADRAARRIRKGLAANRAVIAFPRRLVLVVWGLSVLPAGLRLRLLTGMPKKS